MTRFFCTKQNEVDVVNQVSHSTMITGSNRTTIIHAVEQQQKSLRFPLYSAVTPAVMLTVVMLLWNRKTIEIIETSEEVALQLRATKLLNDERQLDVARLVAWTLGRLDARPLQCTSMKTVAKQRRILAFYWPNRPQLNAKATWRLERPSVLQRLLIPTDWLNNWPTSYRRRQPWLRTLSAAAACNMQHKLETEGRRKKNGVECCFKSGATKSGGCC